MRGKKQNVCHTCRQHKIGCDGLKPACSQCRLTGRVCEGYVQELIVVHHKPAPRRRRKTTSATAGLEQCRDRSELSLNQDPQSVGCRIPSSLITRQSTYEECVAILIENYIPKDEIPFLLQVEPSRSRICGGWVQALPHVSQNHADFERIILPAVRALTMAMIVTSTRGQQEYLDTYGSALQGIRSVLERTSDSVDSTVAIAGMCLALSEVLVPTSNDGYRAHLQGVAAMMQSRDPSAFQAGFAHLMFVGIRPLIILDAITKRKPTFLMDDRWRRIPFSTHHPSPMQVLLGHATSMAPLLEKMNDRSSDPRLLRTGFRNILSTLQEWEDDFRGKETTYQLIALSKLDLSISLKCLPDPCLTFVDVSQANSLTHCWAFRIVCLLQLLKLESQLSGEQKVQCTSNTAADRQSEITRLCILICRGIPYLLQKEMCLYGSMSAGFPLHTVLESKQTLQLEEDSLTGWYDAINELLTSQRIASYEKMAGSEVSCEQQNPPSWVGFHDVGALRPVSIDLRIQKAFSETKNVILRGRNVEEESLYKLAS